MTTRQISDEWNPQVRCAKTFETQHGLTGVVIVLRIAIFQLSLSFHTLRFMLMEEFLIQYQDVVFTST